MKKRFMRRLFLLSLFFYNSFMKANAKRVLFGLVRLANEKNKL